MSEAFETARERGGEDLARAVDKARVGACIASGCALLLAFLYQGETDVSGRGRNRPPRVGGSSSGYSLLGSLCPPRSPFLRKAADTQALSAY